MAGSENAAVTPKQTKFVSEYIKSGNATQAAIRAGYSKKTAYSIGQQNLKKLEIKNAIESRQKKTEKKAEFTRERAMELLLEIAENSERDSARVAAITQAARMCGWESAQKHEIDYGRTLDLSEIPTDELKRRLAEAKCG